MRDGAGASSAVAVEGDIVGGCFRRRGCSAVVVENRVGKCKATVTISNQRLVRRRVRSK